MTMKRPRPSADLALGQELIAAAAKLRWRPAFLSFLLGALPFIAVFAHRGVAPLTAAALIAAPWGAWRRRRMPAFSLRTPSGQILWGLTGLAGVTALSALWSPARGEADEIWGFPLTALVGVGVVGAFGAIGGAPRIRARAALVAGVGLMAAMLAFEGLTGGLLRDWLSPQARQDLNAVSLGRGAVILVVLIWPAAAILTRSVRWRLFGLGLIALSGLAALTLGFQANLGAFLAGLGGFVAALRWPRAALQATFAVVFAALAVSPLAAIFLSVEQALAMGAELPLTWAQRLVAAAKAGDEIAAAPLLGGGVEYARHLASERELVAFPGHGVSENVMPLHPHNLFLHIWLELGALGAACAALLCAGLRGAALAAARDRFDAAMIAGLLTAFLFYAATEWSLWQVWRIALLFLCAGAVHIALHKRAGRAGHEQQPLAIGDRG